ncbi:hypothetical protein [Corynebacterium urinipleomorphum]|uniref:hypothetical protein n=1 Tax=Corynebacterium urinipleomorphum TaxID=1852380 RepID=UPI000B34CECE|nr:hypothetical protein [Corynebacterium urinipleomorphum]
MKIRKGLLAAATAATVSFSGVVAAPAFAETNASNPTVATDVNGHPLPEGSSGKQLSQNATDLFYAFDKEQNRYILSATKIGGWITLFTSILGAVTAIINFAQKNFNIKR